MTENKKINNIMESKITPYLGAECNLCLEKCFGGAVDKENKLHSEEELAQKECDFQKPNCSKKGDLEWFCLPYFKNDTAICKNCEKYLADKLSKMSSEIQKIEYLFQQLPSRFRTEIDMDKIIEEVCQENSLTCVSKEKSIDNHAYEINNNIEYSPYGSKIKGSFFNEKRFREVYEEIKNSPCFYQQAPFLTIAEDLLKLIREGKVEELIFLSAYDKSKFPKGDDRKYEIFRDTFGITLQRKYPCNIKLKLIENASDFDIVIDDNPNICRSLVESNGVIKPCYDCAEKYKRYNDINCKSCEKMKLVVLTPYYPAVENQHHSEVLLIKNEHYQYVLNLIHNEKPNIVLIETAYYETNGGNKDIMDLEKLVGALE
ncbi:13277_t:CDS:2, partial [Funneliformis geosporum]